MAVKRICDCCGLEMTGAVPDRARLKLPHPREDFVMYIAPKPDIQGWDVCTACVCKAFAQLLSAAQIADILHDKITPPTAAPDTAMGAHVAAGSVNYGVKAAVAGELGHDGRKFLSREPTADQIQAADHFAGGAPGEYIAKFWRAMYDAG